MKYQLQFGAPHGAANGNADITAAADDVLDFDGATLPVSKARLARIKNVRMTAAPNTCLFDGGMRYLQNSVVVENQTEPYTACMAQLVTKTDLA